MSETQSKKDENRWPLITLIMLFLLLTMGLLVGRPVYLSLRKTSDIAATQSLVDIIATAISTYQLKTWTWEITKPGDSTQQFKSYHIWDLNIDGFIDGRPALSTSPTTDGGFSPELLKTNYHGFMLMAAPAIPNRFIQENLQPIDVWGNLLRINHHKTKHAPETFCVWSIGPDGIDGTPDDLLSTRPKLTPPVTPAPVQ